MNIYQKCFAAFEKDDDLLTLTETVNDQKSEIQYLNTMVKREQRKGRNLLKNNILKQGQIVALKADIRRYRKRCKRDKNVLRIYKCNNQRLKKENADLLANFDACIQDMDSEIVKRDNLIKELLLREPQYKMELASEKGYRNDNHINTF